MTQSRPDERDLGQSQPAALTCLECRSPMNRDDQFCTSCGTQRQPLVLGVQEKSYQPNESAVLALVSIFESRISKLFPPS